MEYLIQAIKEFGPQIGILCFFIWRDYNREKSMNTRLIKLEDYQKTKLESLIVTTQAAILDNMHHFKNLTDVLITRPCIKDSIKRMENGDRVSGN